MVSRSFVYWSRLSSKERERKRAALLTILELLGSSSLVGRQSPNLRTHLLNSRILQVPCSSTATQLLSKMALTAGCCWFGLLCYPRGRNIYRSFLLGAPRFPIGKRDHTPDLPLLALRIVPSDCIPHFHRCQSRDVQALILSFVPLPLFLCVRCLKSTAKGLPCASIKTGRLH